MRAHVSFIIAILFTNVVSPSPTANSHCRHDFEELSQEPNTQALTQLKHHLKQAADAENKIEIQDGRVVLKIASMDSSEDLTFMKLVISALKKGEIDEIQATVQGPKVLTLVSRMKSRLPNDKVVVFKGSVSMSDLFERMGTDLAVQETGIVANLHRSRMWSLSDQIDFFDAIKDLGISDACFKVYGTRTIPKCGPMNFVISSDPSAELLFTKPE